MYIHDNDPCIELFNLPCVRSKFWRLELAASHGQNQPTGRRPCTCTACANLALHIRTYSRGSLQRRQRFRSSLAKRGMCLRYRLFHPRVCGAERTKIEHWSDAVSQLLPSLFWELLFITFVSLIRYFLRIGKCQQLTGWYEIEPDSALVLVGQRRTQARTHDPCYVCMCSCRLSRAR